MAAERNEVQVEFDAFGKAAGMTKQSGSWYRASHEVITAMNLQKSQYSFSYYINVGWWLRALADAKFPTEHEWHIGIRLDMLLPDRAEEVKALLDLERPVENRADRLRELLQSELLPILERTASLEGLRTLRGESRRKAAAVRGRLSRSWTKPWRRGAENFLPLVRRSGPKHVLPDHFLTYQQLASTAKLVDEIEIIVKWHLRS